MNDNYCFYSNLLEKEIKKNKENNILLRKYYLNFNNISLIKFNPFVYHATKNEEKSKICSVSKSIIFKGKRINVNIARYWGDHIIEDCRSFDLFPNTSSGTVFFVDVLDLDYREYCYIIKLKENLELLKEREKEFGNLYNIRKINQFKYDVDTDIIGSLNTGISIFLCSLKYDIDIDLFILNISGFLKFVFLLEDKNEVIINFKKSKILEWKVFNIVEEFLY